MPGSVPPPESPLPSSTGEESRGRVFIGAVLIMFHVGVSQGCQMAKFDPFFSLDCARVEGVGAQSKGRKEKGSNFAVQLSRAIVMKSEGQNTYDLKIWL